MSDGLEDVLLFVPIPVAAGIDGCDCCGVCMENLATYDAMNDGTKRHPILLMNHTQRKCPIFLLTHPTDSSGTTA